jgi:hypothetical protein
MGKNGITEVPPRGANSTQRRFAANWFLPACRSGAAGAARADSDEAKPHESTGKSPF